MAHLLSLASMTLEILNGVLVFFGRRARLERAEIAAPAGLRIDLARIEPVAAGLELADHRRRILDHLRHGVAPQPMPLRRRTIGEYRQVAGRIVQSGKLEPGIGGRLL